MVQIYVTRTMDVCMYTRIPLPCVQNSLVVMSIKYSRIHRYLLYLDGESSLLSMFVCSRPMTTTQNPQSFSQSKTNQKCGIVSILRVLFCPPAHPRPSRSGMDLLPYQSCIVVPSVPLFCRASQRSWPPTLLDLGRQNTL
jgi:hypothetical protein